MISRFSGLFGLSMPPFVLEDTIKRHVEHYKQDQPQTVMKLKQSIHVDDVIGGGESMESAKGFKENIVKICKLHKWHSDVAELEEEEGDSQKETNRLKHKQNNS